jgi:hypothetical protein
MGAERNRGCLEGVLGSEAHQPSMAPPAHLGTTWNNKLPAANLRRAMLVFTALLSTCTGHGGGRNSACQLYLSHLAPPPLSQ